MTVQQSLATNDPHIGTTRTVPSGTNTIRTRAEAVTGLQHAAQQLVDGIRAGDTLRMARLIADVSTALRRLRDAPETRFEIPADNGTDTSKAASKKLSANVNFGSMKHKVLGYIWRRGGLTDAEIETGLDMKHQTASARRRELVLTGMVVDSGERRDGMTVWITTDIGASVAAELASKP